MITAASLDDNMEPLARSFELGAMDYISKTLLKPGISAKGKIAYAWKSNVRNWKNGNANPLSEKLLPICSYCKRSVPTKITGRKWKVTSLSIQIPCSRIPFVRNAMKIM
jgi:hypothetical protein